MTTSMPRLNVVESFEGDIPAPVIRTAPAKRGRKTPEDILRVGAMVPGKRIVFSLNVGEGEKFPSVLNRAKARYETNGNPNPFHLTFVGNEDLQTLAVYCTAEPTAHSVKPKPRAKVANGSPIAVASSGENDDIDAEI